MSTAWQSLPERSNAFWLRTIAWIALHLGRPLARGLLYPITAYFLLVRNATLPAARRFLRRALAQEPGWRDLFRLYHTFACTLLDRLFVLAGQDHRLSIRVQGLEVLERFTNTGSACLLVGSHLGSFEIIRALGRSRLGLRVKVLMDTEATPQITRLYRSINPSLYEDIVPMNQPGALLELVPLIRQGGMLALLGDRCLAGDRRAGCRFFGEPIDLPQTPFMLAQALELPMVLFFCLHEGWGRYTVVFEDLAPFHPLPRRQREAAAQATMQHYTDRLEHHARRAPWNWFNFHDIWQREA